MDDRRCDGCALHSRRDFMRDAVRAVALSIGATILLPDVAGGAPRMIGALAARGTERRYAIPEEGAVSIDAEAEVIVARAGGAVYAFSLACPHQRTALRWEEGSARFRCPKHKSTFRPDGTFIEGRAKRPMDRFAVRREDQILVVDVDRLLRFDRDADAWASAVVRLTEK